MPSAAPSDISLRILAEYFEGRMGKKFFVENKPGAGSRIANQTVAHADPGATRFYMRQRLMKPPKPWQLRSCGGASDP
jgi:tripartite-type tricarboxylate transporter receptor subunit TctC